MIKTNLLITVNNTGDDMMVVITLSCCPPKLRGDLSRWMQEIDTGVYVGNLNARVRDNVWDRVCSNIGNGHASMSYSSNNEQKLEFRIHNTQWEPLDYDGIKLIKRRVTKSDDENVIRPKAMTNHINRLSEKKQKSSGVSDTYTVIDIETTGLNPDDEIIELGAVTVENGSVAETYSVLVKTDKKKPKAIIGLTGITEELLANEGSEKSKALSEFAMRCSGKPLVGHNIGFDLNFIKSACAENKIDFVPSKIIDTVKISRKLLDINSYSLSAIADYLDLHYNKDRIHRALDDCLLTQRIYEKLKEI